jgi:hypothetical protein
LAVHRGAHAGQRCAESRRPPCRRSVANISSGAGLVNTNIPTDIVTLIVNAIEVGYASALNDVRDRDLENHGLGPIDI